MSVGSFLSDYLVLPACSGTTPAAVVEALLRTVHEVLGIATPSAPYPELLRQKQLGCVLNGAVAVVCLRLAPGVTSPEFPPEGLAIATAVTGSAIESWSRPSAPVRVVFLVIARADASSRLLGALADLRRLYSDGGVIKKLLDCHREEEVVAVLRDAEARHEAREVRPVA